MCSATETNETALILQLLNNENRKRYKEFKKCSNFGFLVLSCANIQYKPKVVRGSGWKCSVVWSLLTSVRTAALKSSAATENVIKRCQFCTFNAEEVEQQ